MYHYFNDMTWPIPCGSMGELEYTLRYGRPTYQDHLIAASIVAAYRELIAAPRKVRESVVSELRKGPTGEGQP